MGRQRRRSYLHGGGGVRAGPCSGRDADRRGACARGSVVSAQLSGVLGLRRLRAMAGLCPLGLLQLSFDKAQLGYGDGELFEKARNVHAVPSHNMDQYQGRWRRRC